MRLERRRAGAPRCSSKHIEARGRPGARIVCLQELTSRPISPSTPTSRTRSSDRENVESGRPCRSPARWRGAMVARHASLRARWTRRTDLNTAIGLEAGGEPAAPAPARSTSRASPVTTRTAISPRRHRLPVVEVAGSSFGFPTCWDQWFPELARIYSLEGAEILVYPTAIGSEPHLAEFDTQPLWEQLIVRNGSRTLPSWWSSTGSGSSAHSSSTDPRSSPTRMGASWSARPVIDRRFWSPTSISTTGRDHLNFGLIATRRPDQYSGLVDGAGGTKFPPAPRGSCRDRPPPLQGSVGS